MERNHMLDDKGGKIKTNFIGCSNTQEAESPTAILFCQHEISQTTLLHLLTAQNSLFFFHLKYPRSMKNKAVW